jgi:hypothetical protein
LPPLNEQRCQVSQQGEGFVMRRATLSALVLLLGLCCPGFTSGIATAGSYYGGGYYGGGYCGGGYCGGGYGPAYPNYGVVARPYGCCRRGFY